MGGASNRSDDSGGGNLFSQLKKIQKKPVVEFIKGGGSWSTLEVLLVL